MDTLLTQQHLLVNHIANFIVNTKKAGKEKLTEEFLQSRIDLLEKYWEKFQSTHINATLQASNEDLEQPYFKENMFDATELVYCENYGLLSNMLKAYQSRITDIPATNNTYTSTVNTVNSLPKIQLTRFGGDLKEWSTFHDLFKSLVDSNKQLSGSQKLYYLKTCVYGPAEQLIRNIVITDANYSVAWTVLCERYQNQRLLVSSYLKLITSLPAMKSESAEGLRKLYDGTNEAVKALEALNRPVHRWDDWLIFNTTQKLDSITRKDWENSLTTTSDLPSFKELCTFLQHRVNTLEAISSCNSHYRDSARFSQHKFLTKSFPVKAHVVANKPAKGGNAKCPKCTGKHLLLFCPSFRQQTVEQRREFVAKDQLCFNCLRPYHTSVNCPSTYRCKHCNQLHHSMLHISQDDHSMSPTQVGKPSTTATPLPVNALTTKTNCILSTRTILLATARVILFSPCGKRLLVRALLDQGSQATFISAYCASYLQLPHLRVNIPVKGIGSSNEVAHSIVHLSIQSCVNPDFSLDIDALVLSKLTRISTPERINHNDFPHLRDLQLSDPDFMDNSPIDLIIGADLYHLIILEGLRKGTPTAQKTSLGWVLSGPINGTTYPHSSQVNAYHTSTEECTDQLDLLLRKFWEIEDIPPQCPILSEEDRACEDYYRLTTKREPNGRYIVRLPIRSTYKDAVIFGDSKQNAIQNLKLLEKRFNVNSNLKGRYTDFMEEYANLNHMELVTNKEYDSNSTPTFYLPHHGVLNVNSLSTKLRVVFNGSRKSKGGLSLNDYLAIGPKLQSDICTIVLRWRQYYVAFAADIRMMYRQIRIDRQDCDLQRIVWRKDASEPVAEYRLLTVTYGTTSAPYLALRTLLQLAEDEESRYPLGAQLLRTNFYVDDVLFGADDLQMAVSAQKELVSILQAGGFQLHKWSSNSARALHMINAQSSPIELNLSQDPVVKTLGLFWNPTSDCFGVHVKLPDLPITLSKRILLSDIARLYDPLGFLSPTIILAKSLIQKLWLLKLDWDTPLTENIKKEWLSFRQELKHLENIAVPRWIGIHSSMLSYELHAFSDASEIAYSAVVYLRAMHENSSVQTSLLCAKTKLAPLKKLSIPRLELMGAHLVARLLNSVKCSLDIKDAPIYGWTDSMTALTWITSHPSKWKTFVGNRVSQILELIPTAKWKYVPSSSNPADCASRGIKATQLVSYSLWWEGPGWLKSPSTMWPQAPAHFTPNSEVHFEEKQNLTCAAISLPVDEHWDLIKRYSCLTRLLRITAWCYRFLQNSKVLNGNRIPSDLSPAEIERALLFWVAHDQRIVFPNEYQRLSIGRQVPNRSALLKLFPIYDITTSIIRVGGRLQNSNLSDNSKHPIVLAKHSPLATLIVGDAHSKTLHGGLQLTLNFIRQRFWILGCKDLIRQRTRRCLVCIRYRTFARNQLMGILPSERVKPSRPFLFTGLDYAGPIMVRYGPGRGKASHKAYIALFVCMSTKAIHLELVSDLTTNAFIAAYKRFTARRGYCRKVFSDNATTFAGAAKELKEAMFQCQSRLPQQLSHLLTLQGTDWHFIPPNAPNFGGLWEAGVKAIKHHLKRVIGSTTLTFEELYSVLTQIEACVNPRPLYSLSSDANDIEALTPGHFLIGSAPITVPEPTLEFVKTNGLSRWKLLQQMYGHFWKRWSTDYLNNLQTRTKWMRKQDNIKPGLLVLLRDTRFPPSKWALGRIAEVHPGPDGLVRVVTVHIKGHLLKRPINQVCALPFLGLNTPGSIEDPSRRAETLANGLPYSDKNEARQQSDTFYRPTDEAGGDVST